KLQSEFSALARSLIFAQSQSIPKKIRVLCTVIKRMNLIWLEKEKALSKLIWILKASSSWRKTSVSMLSIQVTDFWRKISTLQNVAKKRELYLSDRRANIWICSGTK